ncbi:hypothetical protein VPH35_093024 [Triticum aestivum]
MAGPLGYSKFADMSTAQEFIELVRGNWGKRLQPMPWHTSQEVNKCIEIALRCVEADRVLRPTITEIVDELRKIDTMKRSSTSQDSEPESKMRAIIDPLELRFPLELNKEVRCVLQLTNMTGDTIVFNVKMNQDKYYAQPEERDCDDASMGGSRGATGHAVQRRVPCAEQKGEGGRPSDCTRQRYR